MNSMKKLLLIFILLLSSLFFGKNYSVNELLKENGQTVVIWMENKKSYIASLYLTPDKPAEIAFESSGFDIKLTKIEEKEDSMIVCFLKLWIGAEETEQGEARSILKYTVCIPKQKIYDVLQSNKKFVALNIDIANTLDFVLVDSIGSVKLKGYFYITKKTEVYTLPTIKSLQMKTVSIGEPVELDDIQQEITSVIFYWVKIHNNEVSGWVPLDCVSEEWTVKEDTVNRKNDRFYAVNDDRVRIREEPNLTGKTLGHLNRTNKVRIIEYSDKKEKIEGMESYWYKVQTDEGLTGWVYGAYIDIDSQ
jgi:hypothetical protein